MARADLARRLDKLSRIIRPTHSLAAKVEGMSDADRMSFEAWKLENARWHERFANADGAFVASLNDDRPPPLPHWLESSLFGPVSAILKSTTLAAAAEMYAEYREKRS